MLCSGRPVLQRLVTDNKLVENKNAPLFFLKSPMATSSQCRWAQDWAPQQKGGRASERVTAPPPPSRKGRPPTDRRRRWRTPVVYVREGAAASHRLTAAPSAASV